jgi:hypothetical protein
MGLKKVVINPVTRHRGFFSYLTCLLAVLEKYETEKVSIYIDWSGAGNYADPSRGPNIFDYFFKQPFLERISDDCEIIGQDEGPEMLTAFSELPLHEVPDHQAH